MPHTKSAAKRLRQAENRRKRNKTWVKQVKKQTRAVADALKGGDKKVIATEVTAAAKKLDKAAAKGVIHKNKAARMKSRLAKKANATAAKG
ncbi:MAG TPA: 30S ribosomal protein S20 [Fimbriiglobus sp.]|jgi:small subunit ribosomal protein S20|nr:30S ribosomal protein S20 [Fimbriiglobus sp.]